MQKHTRNNTMSNNEYSTQRMLNQYYTMHYGPFLKKGGVPCLTEPYYQEMMHILKPYLNTNTQLLDLGCALGRMVFECAKHRIDKAVGIDISTEFISECQKIAKNQHEGLTYPVPIDAKIDFQVADAQALPLAESSFNCILCLNLIDRVPHPKKVIEQIESVLSPNGLLLISDPYEWEEKYTSPSEFVENMRDLFCPAQWEIILEIDRVPFTILVYDRKTSIYANHTLLLRKRKRISPGVVELRHV